MVMGRRKDLYKEMRSRGVRKKVAKEVASSLAKDGKAQPKVARRAASDLSSAAIAIESEMGDSQAKRKVAAKKAAKTRRKRAARRSKAAQQLAEARPRS